MKHVLLALFALLSLTAQAQTTPGGVRIGTTGTPNAKAVNYAQLTPVLLEAIKELHAQLGTQAQRADQAQAAQQADHAALLSLQQQLDRLQQTLAPTIKAQR